MNENMSKLTIYDMNGSSVGELDFADSLLTLDKGNQAVHDMIVAIMAGRRKGTASTLRKGEVAGSNKKPWKQKGTGRARAGYRQSPIWRGGGVAFGPHPRDYSIKVNKKVAQLAFKRVFSDKVTRDKIKVLDNLTLPEAKTKLFSIFLKSLGINEPVLFLVDKIEKNVNFASRNIPNVEIVKAENVNVYQLLRYPVAVIDKLSIEKIKLRLIKKR